MPDSPHEPSPRAYPEGLFDDLALRGEFSANVVGFCRHLRRHGSGVSAVEQMDALRDQLFAVEDEMAKLNERVDFTEKLLEAPRAQPGLAEPSDLP